MEELKMKPELTRPCPLCGGPMVWCGDVRLDDMEQHICHEIVCEACDYSVDFHGDDPNAETMEQYLQWVASKWNAERGSDMKAELDKLEAILKGATPFVRIKREELQELLAFMRRKEQK
jgi:hypothetical protein